MKTVAKWIDVKCRTCGKSFKITERRFNDGRGKYCCMKCKKIGIV